MRVVRLLDSNSIVLSFVYDDRYSVKFIDNLYDNYDDYYCLSESLVLVPEYLLTVYNVNATYIRDSSEMVCHFASEEDYLAFILKLS